MIFVQPEFDRIQEYMDLSQREHIAFELLDFAFPTTVDEKEKLEVRIDFYKTAPCGSLHGALVDTNVASMDDKIRKISQQRSEQSCRIAKTLGINHVIFHTDFMASIPDVFYKKNWYVKNAEFYVTMIEKHKLNIYVENTNDYYPDMLRLLMRKANHDKLAVCLDIGHLNYSKAPMEEWFAELHQHIRYIHLSDNQGIYDDHMAIGDGTVDWLKFHRLIEKYRIHPMVTLEVSGMENVLKSIHFLKENKIFPFGGDSHGR